MKNPLQKRFKEWATLTFGIKNPRVCYYCDGEPYIAEYEIPFRLFLNENK